MRENSGHDESNNNNLDPTLKEHEGEKGPAQKSSQIRNENFEIAGNAKVRGDDPSPDNRARGETSVQDPAPPIDIDR